MIVRIGYDSKKRIKTILYFFPFSPILSTL